MNPTELQRRLDAVAAPHEDASEAERVRNRELVAARRRRRRVGGAAVAGVAAAAALVVAVTWGPPGDPLTAQPASPVRAVDPASLAVLAEECARSLPRGGPVAALAGGASDLARAVLYRFDDGETRFCTSFAGGSVDGPVTDDPVDQQVLRGWVSGGEDDPVDASVLGRRPAGAARVVVVTPDGREHPAVFLDRYWWTPVAVPDESQFAGTTWAAFDTQGRLVDQGPVRPAD